MRGSRKDLLYGRIRTDAGPIFPLVKVCIFSTGDPAYGITSNLTRPFFYRDPGMADMIMFCSIEKSRVNTPSQQFIEDNIFQSR